jgi:3-hydroxyisobutyrate dehydrogenase-like beta-hydroxyacid dehydrogenase
VASVGMRIGVVGLGRMGRPIAVRLLDAGHEVTVFNRTPGRADDLVARGATLADSLPAVWQSADACITMLADDEALLAVTAGGGGLLPAAPAGRALIDMSTVSVTASGRVAEAAASAGVAYLRAPVSGNPAVVEAGNLTIMVSGDEDEFRRLEQTLADIGPHIFFVGRGEEARVLKLALNLMVAGTCELMAEAIALGEAAGLDRAAVLEVMGTSAIGSPFVKYKTANLVARDYTATFTVELMQKDLDLALGAGDGVGVRLPVTSAVRGLLAECIANGHGDLDLTALLLNLEQQVAVAKRPPKS